MDFFGIGPMELMLILILALVVFGPGKLPEIGAKLGGALREMRKATREFSREIDETRQAIEGPINDMKAPMQDLAEPFQAAGAAVAGAHDVLSNPSKAIEGYVMGQYAAADKPIEATTVGPPPAHPTEPAEVLAADAVAADAVAADAVAADAVAADAVAAEPEAEVAELAGADALAADAVVTETEVVAQPASEAGDSEAAATEPAAEAEKVAATEAEPVESIDPETTSRERAESPDPDVVSAIAAMENIFPSAEIASPAPELTGDSDLEHKIPGTAEAQVSAADSEGAGLESPATSSSWPAAASAPSDVATGAPEPPRAPAQSIAVESAEQVSAALPPPPSTANKPDSSAAAGHHHRTVPRVAPGPGATPPPDQGAAPSSDQPASQD